MRKEVIGDSTLYLGECQEVLPLLEQVDATITDPPYEVDAHTLQRRVRRYDSGPTLKCEPLPFSAIGEDLRSFVGREIPRRTRGWALAFCQVESILAWKEAFEAGGAHYRRAMVWVKPGAMPQFSGDRPGMGYESIVSVWCGDGRSVWNGGGRTGVFIHNAQNTKAPHPTTKPQPLMQDLVNLFSNPEEVILDPFMGSGSTGVAAIALGRKFVGIEINEDYFNIACDRIAAELRKPKLWKSMQGHTSKLVGGA